MPLFPQAAAIACSCSGLQDIMMCLDTSSSSFPITSATTVFTYFGGCKIEPTSGLSTSCRPGPGHDGGGSCQLAGEREKQILCKICVTMRSIR